MNVCIVGCGAWGEKRAKSIEGAGCKLVACADVNAERAALFSVKNGPNVKVKSWEVSVQQADVEVVIVSVPIDSLALVAKVALEYGKNVLIEKPAARNVQELLEIQDIEKASGRHVRVGFNLRYHRAFRKAFEIVEEIGPLMYVRGRYGHGGRMGYEKEWRMKSGAGELIDQGVHLIDLAQAFLGAFDKKVQGEVLTCYWPGDANDNAFLTLRTEDAKIAFLHASYTEWKNLFSFEVFGRKGKIEVSGLGATYYGGSYGTEKLTLYKMKPEMGPPETTSWEYPMADDSLEWELREFVKDIEENRTPRPGLAEAIEVMRVVENVKK